MEKKLIYSLLTLTAVSPAANAKAPDVDAHNFTNLDGWEWTQDEQGTISLNGLNQLVISKGAPVSLNLGKLAKGSYKFEYTIAPESEAKSATVLITGQDAVTIDDSKFGVKQTVEFEASGEESYSITLSAEESAFDQTDKFSTAAGAWVKGSQGTAFGENNNADPVKNLAGDDVKLMETWHSGTDVQVEGAWISQEVEGLPNGKYQVTLYAVAVHQTQYDTNEVADGATDVTYVFANDKKQPVPVHVTSEGDIKGKGWTTTYTVEAEVTDGKLNIGLGAAKPGANWCSVQVYEVKRLSSSFNADLKLELIWDDNAALNKLQTLLNTITTQIQENWPGIDKDKYQAQLEQWWTVGIGILYAGSDEDKYDAYSKYEFYKGDGNDVITGELLKIQKAAHTEYVENKYAEEIEVLNAALGGTPDALYEEVAGLIEALTTPDAFKAARAAQLSEIKGKIDAYKDKINGFKAAADGENTDDNKNDIDYLWTYAPDTTPDEDFEALLNTLKANVQADQAKAEVYATFIEEIGKTATALETVNEAISGQKQKSVRQANTLTSEGIENDIDALKTAEATAYETALGQDGGTYAYDDAALNGLNADIATLAAKVETDNATYAGNKDVYATAITTAQDNYDTQVAAVNAAITETPYAGIKKEALDKMEAQKALIDAKLAALEAAYEAGEDFDAAAYDVAAETAEINTLAGDVIAKADACRTNYNNFKTAIDNLTAQVNPEKAKIDETHPVTQPVLDKIQAIEDAIQQLTDNLVAANYALTVDAVGYAPKTYKNETIADVQTLIDNLGIDKAIAETAAYNKAKADIEAEAAALTAAVEDINALVVEEGYGTPSEKWTVEKAAIDALISNLGTDIDTAYGIDTEDVGTGEGAQTFPTADRLQEIQDAIDAYVQDAEDAVTLYNGFFGNIATTEAAFGELKTAVEERNFYTDVLYVFTAETNYAARIAAIAATIEQAKADLEAAAEKTGDDHKAAMAALDYSTYTDFAGIYLKKQEKTLGNLTNPVVLDDAINFLSDNIQNVQDAYDIEFAKTTRDNISSLIHNDAEELAETVAASMEASLKLDLGIAKQDIEDAYNDLLDAIAQIETDRAAVMANNPETQDEIKAQVAALNPLFNDLHNLEVELAEIEAAAQEASEAKAADDAAQTAILAAFGDLQDELTAAKAEIASKTYANTTYVKEKYSFDAVETAIATLEADIATAAAAQTTVAQTEGFETKIQEISGNIVTEKTKAIDAESRYAANEELKTKYTGVKGTYDSQKQKIEKLYGDNLTAIDEASLKLYIDQFNAGKDEVNDLFDVSDNCFWATLQDIKARFTEKFDTFDGNASEYKQGFITELNKLSKDISAVYNKAYTKYNQNTTLTNLFNSASDAYDDDLAAIIAIFGNPADGTADYDAMSNYTEQFTGDGCFNAQLADVKDRVVEKYTKLYETTAEEKTLFNSLQAELINLKKEIQKVKPLAQAKWDANEALNNKYDEVNTTLAEQRALVGAVAGTNPDEYDQAAISAWRAQFNGEGGFVEQLAAIKAAIDAAYQTTEATDQTGLTAQLDALTADIKAVLPAAKANYDTYQTQLDAYEDALTIYEDSKTALEAFPEQGTQIIIDAWAALNEQKDALDDALAAIQNDYVALNAANSSEQKITNLGTISAAIQNIINVLNGDDGYLAAIASQNEAIYANDILPALQKIRDAYVAAVAVLDSYDAAKNEAIKTEVDLQKTGLNEYAFETPDDIAGLDLKATQQQTAANAAGTIWDTTAILAEIQTYVDGLNQTKADFIGAIETKIIAVWNDIRTERENEIAAKYASLNTNGYNPNNKSDKTIFSKTSNLIGVVQDLVDKVEGEEYIDMTALDATLADERISNLQILNDANKEAYNFVKGKIGEYTKAKTGKVAVAEAEINEIIKDGYDLPQNGISIEEQMAFLKESKVDGAEAWRDEKFEDGTLYENSFNDVKALLDAYDTGMENIKAEAQQWADARAARVAANNALAARITEVNTKVNELVEKFGQTSVDPSVWTDGFDAIQVQEKINAASVIAVPETVAANPGEEGYYSLEEINNALDALDALGNLEVVENAVVAAVIANAKDGKVPGLKADFNLYATSITAEDVAEGKVTQEEYDAFNIFVKDLWDRVHAVEVTIENGGAGLDIDGAIDLEKEIALLQTELKYLIDESFAANIEDYLNRANALATATLPEADYGSADYTDELAEINAAGADIAGEIEAHKEAGDIAPYAAGILANIETLEADLATLKANAAAQAKKVADFRADVAELNEGIDALLSAELTGEYGIYGDELQETLEDILFDANQLKLDVNVEDEDIDQFNLHKDQYEATLADLQDQLAELMAEAEVYAQVWAEQVATNEAVYAALDAKFNEINAEFEEYFAARESYQTHAYSWLNDLYEELLSKKDAFDEKYAEVTLEEADETAYIEEMEDIQIQAAGDISNLAFQEAKYMYGNEQTYIFVEAKDAAWEAWESWSFAATVKATFQTELNAVDAKITKLNQSINNDYYMSKCYENMASYAETAEGIIADYNDIKARMAAFKPFGDADGNGKVNVLDYQKVANMILDPTLQPAEGSDLFIVTDVNQNEGIEVGDLTGIVNIIMGREWNVAKKARKMEIDGEGLSMTITPTQVGTQRIAVSLNNVTSYNAFQLDLVLPEGMTIVGHSLSDRLSENHTLWTRNQQDGSVRYLASSIKGEAINGNEGAVIYIDVETDANYQGGTVEVINALFSDLRGNTSQFSTSSDEATGINTMATMQSLKEKVYDISGKLMNGMKKGVNIIRKADGSTDKVVVK